MDEITRRLNDLGERLKQYLANQNFRELLHGISFDYRVAAGFLVVLAILLSIAFFRRPDLTSVTESESSAGDAGALESTPGGTVVSPGEGRSTRIPRLTPVVDATPGAGEEIQSFVPVISGGEGPTPTPSHTPAPVLTSTPVPTPMPTLDFESIADRLREQGQELGYAKIGFHTGSGGNRTGLGDWLRILDETGVPFFIKSADDAGPLFEAQQIAQSSNITHTLVFRRSGDEYDTPNYDLPPVQAARQHWQLHKDAFPAELDPQLVWIETINEVDKERSEWLGYFAIETARLALRDGYRWAAFGWSSGEPEVTDWTSYPMLEFLRIAGENPDRIAIALHEYSYLANDIGHEYPFKLGRFQLLFDVVDRHGIPRPTVLITEWGWEYGDVPEGDQAMRDIAWAASLYAPYPEIRGAAIWYLGDGYRGIADKAQRLIIPVTAYSVNNYFIIPQPPDVAPIEPDRYSPP